MLEEVIVDVYPWVPPLDVEVEGEGDGEVAVVDHQDVADVQLNFDQIRLGLTFRFVRN